MKNHPGLSVKEAQRLAEEFLAEYNGNIAVEVFIRSTQEEFYGPEATAEKIGTIEGAYHGGRATISIAASNIRDKAALQRTMRHELLGHYGLNTFKPSEKRAILDSILETRQEPSLKTIWERVDRDYADRPELHKAEEVFAFVAEQERGPLGRAWDKVLSAFQKALRRAGLSDSPLTQTELRHEAHLVAEGIRNGSRQQQNFPKTDFDQFRIVSNVAEDLQSKPVLEKIQVACRRRPAIDFER